MAPNCEVIAKDTKRVFIDCIMWRKRFNPCIVLAERCYRCVTYSIGFAASHWFLAMSNLSTKQTVDHPRCRQKGVANGKMYVLSKELEERVAPLHSTSLGAGLQMKYIERSVAVGG